MVTYQRLIGLYSPAPQSGKSTVAGILERDYGFRRRPFAAALKRMTETFLQSLGVSPERIAHYSEAGKLEPIPEAKGATYRKIAQTMGTDWGRAVIDRDIWLAPVINDYEINGGLVVVEDVRFENEYNAILDAGGEMWKIVRPGATVPNGHPSEGRLDGYIMDAVIVNDRGVEDLKSSVAMFLGVRQQ